MKRDQALAAIDKAFEDRISHLFDVFSSNMASEDAAAMQHFINGFALALDAYARARAVVESKLTE